jgi:hypothetical protein
MRTKSFVITVGQRLGLPNYSSANVEVTETVDLDDEDNRKESIEKVYSRLDRYVNEKIEKIAEEKGKK